MDDMGKISFKEVVLALVSTGAIIGSFLLWRSAALLIAQEAFNSYGQFIVSIGSLAGAAALFGIAAIFVRNPWVIFSSAILSIAIPFSFIPGNPLVFIMLGACIILTIFAIRNIRKDFNLSFGFSVAHSLKSGIPLFLTVYGIIISLFYLNDVQKKDAIRAVFPRTVFNVSIRALGGPLRSLTGSESFTPDETVDQFLHDLVKKQLADRGIKIDNVPDKELQRLLAQQRGEIAQSYGIKLTGKELLGDVFYTTIIERISDLLGPYRIYVPYASALTFFLAFKTLSFFVYMVVLGVAFLLIKLMIMTGIVIRKKEQIEMERVTLS